MVDYRFPVEDPQFAPEKFVGIWNTGSERATGVLVGDHYFLSAGHVPPGGVFHSGIVSKRSRSVRRSGG